MSRTVIPVTRLRHNDIFYLNPDLIERVDTHVDTAIRLTDGTEYVVIEPAEEIVRRIVEFRARIIAIAGVLQSTAFGSATDAEAHDVPPGELNGVGPTGDADGHDVGTGRAGPSPDQEPASEATS